MKENKEVNPIDQILDENNLDNIILYNEKNEPFEFEQIAIIPLGDENNQKLYTILFPVTPLVGIAEDEAVVFEINEKANTIKTCEDEQVIDQVLVEYEKLLAEQGEPDNQ